MRKKIGIILLFFLFWVLFPKSHPVFAQKFLTQEEAACHYLDKGEIEKAVEILHRVLKISPDNLNAHLYLGIAFYMRENLEGAFQRFEKVEKEIYKKVDFDRPQGFERPDEVDPDLIASWAERKKKVFFSEDRKGLLYFCRGLTLKEKKDLKNAGKKFKKALRLKYDEMAIRLQLFDLYIKMKNLKSASKQLAELKKISGESDLFVFLDGYLKYRKGSLNDALAAFEEVAPTNLEAKRNIARLHYNSGNYKKAIEILQEILSKHADDKEAQINIGRAYFHLGDTDRAQEYLSRAGLKISPDRYSPKKVPLVYETLLKEAKFDLKCK